MEEMRNAYTILVRKPERRGNLGDLDVDGSTMLEWVLM
jgi:hypothetical protein